MENSRQFSHNNPKPEFVAYLNMLKRCGYIGTITDEIKSNYIDRNISVWPDWLGPSGYDKFLDHIGLKPSLEHVLDREDNDKGYLPGNVRWVTPEVSSQNTRRARLITFNGQTKNLSVWAKEYGLWARTIARRLDIGWSVEDALTIPTGIKPKYLST